MRRILKIALGIVLIGAFLSLAVIIIKPLLAEIRFGEAKMAVKAYLWDDAEKKFIEAINMDPFNSEYPYRYAEFLRRRSLYRDNPVINLLTAEGFYKNAIKLNPNRAEYFLGLAQAEEALFLKDKIKFNDRLGKSLNNFKKALSNDPNGFNINYTAGYAGISLWDFLEENDRNFFIAMLNYSLRQKPWYSEYIYKKLYEKTRDVNLLEKVIPKEALILNIDRKSIERVRQESASAIVPAGKWRGASADGKKDFENGEMFWSGTIYAPIILPKGESTVSIKARSDSANGIFPYMAVGIDGDIIGGVFVNSRDWKEYEFNVKSGGGVRALSVTFTNDGGNKKLKEDRNLYVGEARVVQ